RVVKRDDVYYVVSRIWRRFPGGGISCDARIGIRGLQRHLQPARIRSYERPGEGEEVVLARNEPRVCVRIHSGGIRIVANKNTLGIKFERHIYNRCLTVYETADGAAWENACSVDLVLLTISRLVFTIRILNLHINVANPGFEILKLRGNLNRGSGNRITRLD